MNSALTRASATLAATPHRWLVTGAAGFIGSNLVQFLLLHGQDVVGLDNFATGYPRNLEQVGSIVGETLRERFRFVEGDITDPVMCADACNGVDFVLHQAALASVPRSLEDPRGTHASNVDGFLNVLVAARDAKVRRVIYASSSAVYGDDSRLPKSEGMIGVPLSPYAATKLIDEQYASLFTRCYGLQTIGLRYFNVFGPRQDPAGSYAAVIPLWIAAMLDGATVYINGDGETSRDFCYVDDVVQANVLAALADDTALSEAVYNVASGERTTLLQLHKALQRALLGLAAVGSIQPPVFRDFRAGDVRHSVADISKATRMLGYLPTRCFEEAIAESMNWYVVHRHGS